MCANVNKIVHHNFYITLMWHCGNCSLAKERLLADSSISYFYKKRKKSAKNKSKNSLSIIAVNLHTHKQLVCLANLRKRNECSKSSQGKCFVTINGLLCRLLNQKKESIKTKVIRQYPTRSDSESYVILLFFLVM